MASPSDLAEEREAVRGAVDETNALLADRDIRFRVSGWEHTLPDAGRPQALINAEVERCDVFIGLLKYRWGSPTGAFSSGFEEEYTLAQIRNDASGVPSIHLFFADVPRAQLDDPGASLQQVLAFKEKITSERRALYRNFTGVHDLARQVQSVLLARALAHTETGSTSEPAGTSATKEPAAEAVSTVELDSAREQMSAALQSFIAIIRGEGTGNGFYDQDRVELIARAFGKDKDAIGAHLANRLFKRRSELSISVGEGQLWLRSLLADIGRYDRSGRTIPGWGLLRPTADTEIAELVELARSEENVVAVGAVRVMDELRARPTELFPAADVQSGKASGSRDVAERWVQVLGASPGASLALDLFINTFGVTGPVPDAVVADGSLDEDTARLLRAARSALDGRPQQLASESGVIYMSTRGNAELRRILRDSLEGLSDEDLHKMLGRISGSDLHIPALVLALRRGALSPTQVEKLVQWDKRDHVSALLDLVMEKSEIAEVLLGGENRTKSRALRVALMAKVQSIEELRSAYQSKPWDTEAWEAALSLGDPVERKEARALIDSEAASLRERLLVEIAGREDLVDFVASERLSAAGIALARHLNEGDTAKPGDLRKEEIDRVLRAAMLSHQIDRPRFIEALGEVVDIESASDVTAIKAWLRDLSQAGYAAEWDQIFDTRLARVWAPIAVEAEGAHLREKGLAWLARQASAKDEDLLEWVYSGSSEVRMAAIESLIGRWDAVRLEELLNNYADSGRPYWYNVIAALDARLYGPGVA
jgi:hypothetical protein